jgi:hypothetical protein
MIKGANENEFRKHHEELNKFTASKANDHSSLLFKQFKP